MRHFWKTIGLVGVAAVLCWLVFFRAHCDPRAHAAAEAGDVLAWMHCEFRLSEAQFAAIRALHGDHRRICAEHCAAVGAAQSRLEAARRAGDRAGVAAAEAEKMQAETVCRVSVEAHVRQVAALMDPAQGERYLRLVLPRLAALDHAGPPDLSLQP